MAVLRPHLLLDAPLAGLGIALGVSHGALATLPVAGAALALHSWAVCHPGSRYYLPVHTRVPGDEPAVALSFDDGPDAERTPRVLDLLAEHDARASFFVIGLHARAQGPLLRRMLAEGHTLGLHSHTHGRLFNCYGPARLRRELDDNAAAIAEATGAPPPRLFRPPMGLKNPILAHVCAQRALRVVTWSARALDTRPGRSADKRDRLLRASRPGAILALHDGREPSRAQSTRQVLEILPGLLAGLAARELSARALAASETGIDWARADAAPQRSAG